MIMLPDLLNILIFFLIRVSDQIFVVVREFKQT